MTIATIVTSMKNEAPYILEWVAYHRSIGFDRIVVFANDCTDGTHQMLSRLHKKGEIYYYLNEVPLGKKPHSHALKMANATDEVRSSDYVMVLDADEFLAVKKKPFDVKSLIASMEARNATMMVIPWRIFGSSKQITFKDRPAIDRFTYSMDVSDNPKSGVKTLFKQNKNLRLAIHFPKKVMQKGKSLASEEEFLWIDPDGNRIDPEILTWNGGKNKILRESAEVAHFMIKSLDEYMLKIFRGDGLMNSSRHGVDYWKSADKNEALDLRLSKLAPKFRAKLKRLKSDKELSDLHHHAVASSENRLKEILKNESSDKLRDILKRCTEGNITESEISESRHLVQTMSPVKVSESILTGDIPKSVLLSVTTIGLRDTPSIVKRLAESCRDNAAMFWYAKDFDKRPITHLVEGLKRAKKNDRSTQLGCRYFDNFTMTSPETDWPLDEEVIVFITRDRSSVLDGFGEYIMHSRAKYMQKKRQGFPALKTLFSGGETAADVEEMIASGKIDDPFSRFNKFIAEHPGTIVINIDQPKNVERQISQLNLAESASESISRILKDAIGEMPVSGK
ncbi:glycosyltransferase family 2 protein [Paracoccus saliphilus]|uniref:Glycosyl transferase family 2 n=1 Tax=Paracoccus saliphilus TaxID=405559 RepID=A0AA46A5T4_9RHOB|nr:glycosyltransferase family 2 protein [Paracoccus saliphilus]WCR04548.1 glycosyltransferase family 2 protein [Paracoccus saliphilus]SIS86629.1 Glycosyl transferase family 2 [Paracoccus saliphilus]